MTNEGHFEFIINLQSCYTVDKYVSLPATTYMPAVQHRASLKIGKMATFTPLYGKDLPTHYYNFASYTDLPARMKLPKLLTGKITSKLQNNFNSRTSYLCSQNLCFSTDYIGRIENVTEVMKRSGKRLIKITIQDERYDIKLPKT